MRSSLANSLSLLLALILFWLGLAGPTLASNAYDDIIKKASLRYGIPFGLIKGVIKQESNFNSRAVSHAGAAGLMQLMPKTAVWLGITRAERFNPKKNVLAGTKYLAWLSRTYFGSNTCLVLASYNWGQNRVLNLIKRHKTRNCAALLPYMHSEPRAYVQRVLRYARGYGWDGGYDLSNIPEVPPGGDTGGGGNTIVTTFDAFFEDLLTDIERVIEEEVSARLSSLAAGVAPIVYVCLVLYVLTIAIQVFTKYSYMGPWEFLGLLQIQRLVAVTFLVALVLNTVLYQSLLVDHIFDLDDWLIQTLSSDQETNTGKAMDSYGALVLRALVWAWQDDDILMTFLTSIIFLFYAGFSVSIVILLVITDLGMSIGIIIAPLLFIAAIFEQFRYHLLTWVRFLLGFIFLKLMTILVFTLIAITALDPILAVGFGEPITFFKPAVLIGVGIVVYLQLPTLSTALVGGPHINLGSTLISASGFGVIRGMTRQATGALYKRLGRSVRESRQGARAERIRQRQEA